MTAPTNPEAARFADQLERSLRGGAWHGLALGEALAGVGAELARHRFAPGAHTIEEIVGHVAFWLDGARRRIAGDTTLELAADADWPVVSGPPASPWPEVLDALESAHRQLHGVVLALADERLDDAVPGSDPTVRGMLLGLLQHNAYHAGQIALLAKAGARSAT